MRSASGRLLLLVFTALAPWTCGHALAATQPPTWIALYTDDFEDQDLSAWLPLQFDGANAGWSIKEESGNSFLSIKGHVVLGLADREWADSRVKLRVRLAQGGLLLQYRRNSSCIRYFVGVGVNGIGLQRDRCGSGAQLGRSSQGPARGQWATLEVTGIGGHLQVWLDGALQLDVQDSDPVWIGGIAFEVTAGSQVDIDDIEISGPPAASLEESLIWTKTGGPLGGIGYDIRMRPDNPDIIYSSDAWAGVHISTDGGQTWTASNYGITARNGPTQESIPNFSVTVDPINPNIIWAGMQNGIPGLVKSTDGGKTWTPKTNGFLDQVFSLRGIAVDPSNSDVVYAAGSLSSNQWAGHSMMGRKFDLAKGFVYKSVNGGDLWTRIWYGDNIARYILIDPRDTNVIYVSTGIFDAEAANARPDQNDPGGVGILKSTDGGQTWRALNQSNGLLGLYAVSLSMNLSNPDVLLAGTGLDAYPGSGGEFLSTNGGETWIPGVWAENGRPNGAGDGIVKFAPSDPNIAYLALPGEFRRSSDGGRTWKRMGDSGFGPPGGHVGVPIDLAVDPRNPDRIFLNSYVGGNFLSEDAGRTWRFASKGYTGAQMRSLTVDPNDARRVYAMSRGGPWSSDDAGNTWLGQFYGIHSGSNEWSTVVADPRSFDTVLGSDDGSGTIYRTIDGHNWTLVYQQPGVSQSHTFKTFAFAPSNPDVVYAGMSTWNPSLDQGVFQSSYGVFKSADDGVTWQRLQAPEVFTANISTLVVDPRSEDIVYAGTLDSGVLRSLDGGQSWSPLNNGLPGLDVRILAMDPSNPFVIYAGLESGGVYKTTDAGSSWVLASVGMDPQATVRSLAIDPSNPQTLYAGDFYSGVYCSRDGGALWVPITRGLRTRAVRALAISADGGTVYAGVEGEGVFRLDVKPLDRDQQ